MSVMVEVRLRMPLTSLEWLIQHLERSLPYSVMGADGRLTDFTPQNHPLLVALRAERDAATARLFEAA